MHRFISMFDHPAPTPGKAELASKSGSHENLKLSRAELELRKCLGSDTQECLVKSYSCAWQKEILIQGHLYITPNWFCFYSNILGWETKTCIQCNQVISIKKHRAAKFFPTAVVITTGEKKYGFASFVRRNRSHQVLTHVWQNSLARQPLSKDELVRQLNYLKKQKHGKDTLHLPRKLRPSHDSSGVLYGSDNTADSSDTEHSYPPSPHLTPLRRRQPTRNDSQETTTTSRKLQPDSSIATTTTTQSGSLETDDDHLQVSDVEFPLVSRTPSTASTVSFTGTTTGSDLGVEGGSDSAEYVDIEPCSKRLTSSPSLLALQHDSEQSSSEDRRGLTVSGLQGGKAESEDESASVLQRFRNFVGSPGQWRSGKVCGNVRLWLCSPSNVINLIIVIAIILLVFSTLTMVCKLSQVDPRFQFLLPLQPWCRVCHAPNTHVPSSVSPTPAHLQDGDYVVLTTALFEEMVDRHSGSREFSEPS